MYLPVRSGQWQSRPEIPSLMLPIRREADVPITTVTIVSNFSAGRVPDALFRAGVRGRKGEFILVRAYNSITTPIEPPTLQILIEVWLSPGYTISSLSPLQATGKQVVRTGAKLCVLNGTLLTPSLASGSATAAWARHRIAVKTFQLQRICVCVRRKVVCARRKLEV